MNKATNKNFEWIIHVLIWVVLFALPAVLMLSRGGSFNELFLHSWTQLIALAIIFYLNYLFLLDLWISRKQKLLFIVINLVLLISLSYLRNDLIMNFGDASRRPNGKAPPNFAFRLYLDFLIYLVPVAFAFAIESGKRILSIETVKKEADRIKLQAELQHLKFQLQPHFFFNSLNNIYSLIDTDPSHAKTAIHSLSKLMRYFLQKSDEEKVSLYDELDFLTRYIELMKMRLTDKTTVTVQFPEQIPDVQVPPLALISLVENAFKHGVSASRPSEINISVRSTDKEIIFIAYNTNFPKNTEDRSGSGIGLSNLQKRLQLLYPHHHQFETQIKDNIFTVKLVFPVQQ